MCSIYSLVIVHFDSFERKIYLNYPEFSLGIELQLVTAATDSILRITWFGGLNTNCGWFHPPVDSSSSSWIRVATDSILWLTRVPVAGYELRLILSHYWLEFQWLDTSYSCLRPTTHSSSTSWTRLAIDLYFNISSKFTDLFCKIHHFMVCFLPSDFSYCWFRLWLLLQEPWRSLRKLEKASRLYLRLILVAAADSRCDGWFETCKQSTITRILTLMPPDSISPACFHA